MAELTDREFEIVISKIAANRRTQRGRVWDITVFFETITRKYTLAEFRDYLSKRFKLTRHHARDSLTSRICNGETTSKPIRYPNTEHMSLERQELKTINKRFHRLDRISISFIYNDDWSSIEHFDAALVDCNEIGGPFAYAVYFIVLTAAYVLTLPWRLIRKCIPRKKHTQRNIDR